MAPPPRRPPPAGLLVTSAAALLLALGAGCAPPAPPAGAGGAQPAVYVANAGAGTVTEHDGGSGRRVGPPRPAGPAPARLAAGAGGRVLVVPSGGAPTGALTLVVPHWGGAAARPITLEAGAQPLHLAADGGRYAAVAYVVAGGWPGGGGVAPGPCRLAVVDLVRAAVVGAHAVCAPGEAATGLALAAGDAGPVAYLGLWRRGAGRVVALAADGAVLAAHPLTDPTDTPEDVALGPAPDGAGPRLYVVAEALDPDETRPEAAAGRWASALRWRLLGLHPTTLALERDVPLPGPARGLAVAPDGRDAYALGAADLQAGAALQRIDLVRGVAAVVGRAPGLGVAGPAVTRDRLYVPDTFADRLWVADRAGRPLGTVPAGRRPLGIATGP